MGKKKYNPYNVRKQIEVAIAYARYSSNNQREESIDAQLRAIREYCERENIHLIEVFYDEAQTGKNDDRDNFQRMINAINDGQYKVDAILVHKFNRFARSQFDSIIHKKRLKEIGVRVISVTQNIDDTPEGALLESFLEAIDEYYSANLALEVKKGLRENALSGKFTGGNVAYGFEIDGEGRFVPGADAPIVRRIFEEFAAGVPKTEICETLNNEGIRNQRGNTFNVRTVFDMLRNEKYIGNYIYSLGNENFRLEGIITPIIEFDLWERVQALNNQPIKARLRHQKARYFLTGKTFCGCCGETICGAGSKRMRNGDLYYYYKCVGKTKHRNGCQNPSINKNWYEDNVLKAVTKAVMSEEQIKVIAHMVYEEIKAARETPTISTAQLEKELSGIAKKQERLTDLYLDGELEKNMLDSKNAELRKKKFQLEMEIEKRKAVAEVNDISEQSIYEYVTNYIKGIKAHYHGDNEKYMQAVFAAFIDKVIVSDESISVYVNADFSFFNVGDSRKFAGVIRHIAPVNIQARFKRKKSLFGRTEYRDLSDYIIM